MSQFSRIRIKKNSKSLYYFQTNVYLNQKKVEKNVFLLVNRKYITNFKMNSKLGKKLFLFIQNEQMNYFKVIKVFKKM